MYRPTHRRRAKESRYLACGDAMGGEMQLAIHSTAAGTGYMQVNPDGSVKKIFPP